MSIHSIIHVSLSLQIVYAIHVPKLCSLRLRPLAEYFFTGLKITRFYIINKLSFVTRYLYRSPIFCRQIMGLNKVRQRFCLTICPLKVDFINAYAFSIYYKKKFMTRSTTDIYIPSASVSSAITGPPLPTDLCVNAKARKQQTWAGVKLVITVSNTSAPTLCSATSV